MQVWVNGEITEDKNAISSADRGFTLADGVFETMYFDNSEVELFQMHMIRLKSSLSALHINMPYKDDEILNAIRELFDVNKMKSGAIRLTVTRGVGARGLSFADINSSTVVISSASVERIQTPVRICTTDYIRNEKSLLSSYKTLDYSESIMAFNSARIRGFGDAVMLNTVGNVACCTTSNIFLLRGNVLITPPLKDGCLPGIMRSVIISIAKKMELKILESTVTKQHLDSADAVFLSNSIVRLRKVSSFENIHYDIENEIVNNIERNLR
ncbi:MAG: aminotransferase class IV [Alphaproteobacteria bacterium]